jgi:ABC-type amino acid transport substrate-binding protein
MKKLLTITLSIFIINFLFLSHVYAQSSGIFSPLTIMTEEYPPFNYTNDGELTGLAVEKLLGAAQAAGDAISKDDISVAAWPRAYSMAQAGPNVLLFSMTRTPARESLFKWVGPMAENRVVLIAKKSSNITVTDPSAITDKVGVIRDDIGGQLAAEAGLPSSVVNKSSKPSSVAGQLANGRVQMWAYAEQVAFHTLSDIGEDINDYEVVHVFDTYELYAAFSLDTDDSIINALQAGLDSL